MSDYRWRVLGYDEEPLPNAPTPTFPTQADAESWLSDTWEELAEAGASAVTLYHFEDVVYGPMSLAPPA